VSSPTYAVAGFDRLWVPSEDGVVYAIDPGSMQVVDKIRVEAAHAVAIAFGSVWASSGGDADVVTRIDHESGRVVAEIETPVAGFPDRMAALGGILWVGQYQIPRIIGIDPATNKVVARQPAGAGAAVVAAGFGDLWVANYDDGDVWRLDAR
jgi:outer membrane protein assembly factor BamB